MIKPKLKVYFDGLCHLCSWEISHYRKQTGSDQIEFVDITGPNFNPKAEGLDPTLVHKEIHVRRTDGTLAVGMDAFIAIWEVMPKFRLVSKIAKAAIPNLILSSGYKVFAKVRPYLPRKKQTCETSPYCSSFKKEG